MIAGLIRLALVQRLMMVLLTLAISAAGIWAFRTLPIDAFPEISPPQVQLIIKAPGLTPEEVEARITFPIEMEMQGLTNQTILRSTSKYALSIVVLDFEDGTDIYWARQQVAERLNQVWADLPAGVEGGLAPITSPLGEAFMYRIHGEGMTNTELRLIQDWTIRLQLRGVDGVADVNSLGGEVRAFEVMPLPDKMLAQGISLDELEQDSLRPLLPPGRDERLGDRDDRRVPCRRQFPGVREGRKRFLIVASVFFHATVGQRDSRGLRVETARQREDSVRAPPRPAEFVLLS